MIRRYIVVTPCRNEEKNLPNLVQSMTAQTIKPALWVVVDDGSTDRTGEIIARAEAQYAWIQGVHLGKHKEYMGAHIAYVCNKGFEFAMEYCATNDMPYVYIALVDADNILEARYFEKLIEEFEKDEKLGIASGNTWGHVGDLLNELKKNKKDVNVMDNEFWQQYVNSNISKSREDLPMGSARLWRRECFEETGGYAYVHAPDSVSNVKAKMRGWKTTRFNNIRVIEREYGTARGLWQGYKGHGESDFFMWYPLSIAILKGLNYSFKRPYYSGVAYLLGYIKPLISQKKRIDDVEIRQYYQSIYPKERKAFYKGKFKRLLKVG